MLNQSTHSRVANSTASKLRHGPRRLDDFGLVEAVDGLGEGVVVGVADASDGWDEARFDQALRVFDRHILDAAIAVVDEAVAANRPSIVQRLLERIEHEAGVGGSRHPPADNSSGEGVDDEGDVDEAGPSDDVGEVADPQRVRPRGLELALDLVERTRRRTVADRRFHPLAPHGPLQTHVAHQTGDRASRDVLTFPLHLSPHFAHPIDLEVVVEHAPDFLAQNGVAPDASRSRFGIAPARDMFVVARRGDRQDPADRLDPVDLAVLVDEGDQALYRRSSSAWAK